MTTAVPWNIKGIDFDVRSAVKTAARRAGLSLEQWLDVVIAERAAELGLITENLDEEARLEAIAGRLMTLAKRAERDAAQGSRKPLGDNRGTARMTPLHSDLARAPRAAAYAEAGRRAPAPSDSEHLLEQAIAEFDRRTKVAPRKEVLSRLERSVAAIAGRLEQAETQTAAAGSSDLTRIEAKLNRLSETIDRAARPRPRPGTHGGPLARHSIADAVAEISRRQAVLDDGAAPPSASDRLAHLQTNLAALSTRLEELRSDIAARDEQQFRAIGEKIEALGSGRPDAAALARIRTQTEEIRDLLASAAARPTPIENIEGQIAALVDRVEAIATRGRPQGDAAFAEGRFSECPADPFLQQIEGRIEGLAQRVEEVLSNSGGSGHFDDLRQRLDFIHQSLAARIERPAPTIDTTAFERMMREIVGKLDRPAPAPATTPQLENLISRLTDRLEAPAEIGRLEELVAELADKIELVAKPQPGLAAVGALQDQIERLARRLDDVDANSGAFGSLERSIADLFTELGETRRTAVDAAETAARNAAREAVREIAGTVPATDAQAGNVTRELADLRALQDAADRQTHLTLTAVHETLEKVVDRLAMLEDDIVEVRDTTAGQFSGAGASPRSGNAAALTDVNFAELAATLPRRSAPAQGQDEAPDILIEPGSGFAPERRSGETDRRGPKGPPQPPLPPDAKPPSPPPAAPPSPPAGSTHASFIAAARRTIQANAREAAEASSSPGKAAKALDSALADAKTRAQAAAAAIIGDHTKPADKAHFAAAVFGRAGAFFSTRKRPLVLGLAAIVVALCALELVRSQVLPVDKPAVPAAPAGIAGPASKATFAPGPAAAIPAVQPIVASAAEGTGPAPAKSSSRVTPGIDFSPVGSIASPLAPITAPAAASAADASVDDLAAVRDLAAGGNAAAEFELGARYIEGRGLMRDPALAAQWLEKAARQNVAPAQYRLAALYEKGIGVAHDRAVALDWYQRAATAGNIRAMHNLAVLIAEGSDNKPDYDDAAIWFRRAAEYGVGDSQYNLAILYARGVGVPKDLEQSYIWFALAAAQGDQGAAEKRDEVAPHLDPKQLADAKAIIDGFTPHKALASANTVVPPPGGWAALKAAPLPDLKPAPISKLVPGAKVSAL